MDEIIGEFLVECYEGLDTLDQNLVVLEETPDDKEIITEVFRVIHTIKGTCGFLGFSHLEKVAHRGENLLSLLRDGVLEMHGDIADALLATVDAIRTILAHIEETGEEGAHDHTVLIAELERLCDVSNSNGSDSDVSDGAHKDEPSQSDGTDQLATEAIAVDAANSATEADERIGDVLVSDGAASRTDVEIAAAEQSLGDDRKIGKILVDEGKAAPEKVEAAASKRNASESTIRVDVSVLDSLMNLVGELVLTRNQIVQLSSDRTMSDFQAPAQRLNLITTELQDGVMRTRMQPIGNVWNKLPRVVRDLSQQLGKDVNLEMVGKDTELDRTILEAIKDPLTHMVRNTIDHGIEEPEQRQAIGKATQGLLRLSATHEGGQVTIEIADDGAGIDADKMRQLAIEKGIITAAAAAELSENEAVQLIFAPGFSTAEAVSNVSGRGVGMDVVRSNVERIGGSIDISTKKGEGTTFKIKIPLTLAIVPAVTVRCNNNRYAIPQLNLQELVRLDSQTSDDRIEEIQGAAVYRLRGRLLPIVDLREQLGFEPRDEQVATNIVVLRADERTFGLVVDDIEDTEEIVVKPLGSQVKDNKLFSGATIMGDGTVALILDVVGVATMGNLLQAGSKAFETDSDLEEQDGDEEALLLVGFDDESRLAIQLDDVERLEEFKFEDIEQSGHRMVVQYRGGIMPIVDLGASSGAAPAVQPDTSLSVIVCAGLDHPIGLAARSVVDIVSHPNLIRTDAGDIETAIVDGLVTDVLDVDLALNRSLGIQRSNEEVLV